MDSDRHRPLRTAGDFLVLGGLGCWGAKDNEKGQRRAKGSDEEG